MYLSKYLFKKKTLLYIVDKKREYSSRDDKIKKDCSKFYTVRVETKGWYG